MNQQARHYQHDDERTLTLLWAVLMIFAALTLWGVIKMNSGAAITGAVCGAFFGWALWLHYDARADEAAILSALGKCGYLTQYQITSLVISDMSAGDVLPALNRLEERGLVIYRDDWNLGRMWAKASHVYVPV